MPRGVIIALLLATAAAASTDPLLVQYNRAYRLAGQGKPDEALSILMAILERDPAYYRAYDLAMDCYAAKNETNLLDGFVQELSRRIGRPDAHLLYGRTLAQLMQRHTGQARETARRCLEELPDWIGCHHVASGVGPASFSDPAISKQRAEFLRRHALPDVTLPSFELELRTRLYFEPDAHRARANQTRVLELAVQLGDEESELRALTSLMTLAFVEGDSATAERQFERLWTRAAEFGNTSHQAGALVTKATYHREQGDAQIAIGLYRRAVELHGQIGRTGLVANDLRQLAECELRAGESGAAYDHLQRAVSEARTAHNTSIEAFALGSLASIAADRGDYGEAIGLAMRARTIFTDRGELPTAGGVTGNLGVYLEKLGDWAGAEANYLAALRSADRFNDRGERERLLNRLASLATRRGDLPKAAARLRESLASSMRSGNRRFALQTRILLGGVLSRQGDHAGALAILAPTVEESRALNDVAMGASAWNALGNARLADNRLVEAAEGFRQALAMAGRADEAVRVAHQGLGDAARRGGRLAEAATHYAAAITSIESVRGRLASAEFRTSFLSGSFDAYDHMVALLARQNRAREALEYAERGRARVLLDRVGATRVAEPLSAQRLQRAAARSGAVLLEYWLGESGSWVWAVDGESITVAPLASHVAIESAVVRHREAIMNRQADAGQALYRMLIGPVQPRVTQAGALIVIPDGVLNYLPFETLKPAPGSFLGARFVVSYAPSASVLAELQDRPGQGAAKELLAFGDPDFGGLRDSVAGQDAVRAADERNGLRLTALPSSRREVRDIAALYPPSTVSAYLGSAATKASLTAERLDTYKRIHFATHAFVDESRPERSGIALAADGRRDPILRVPEIARLRISADLVVLSACQTGLGKLIRGEGVAGLRQAFLHAGASRVVASLWPVNDTATAEFMGLFYRNMNHGATPSAALRQAKTAMMNSPVVAYHDPQYWAAFVLIGRP